MLYEMKKMMCKGALCTIEFTVMINSKQEFCCHVCMSSHKDGTWIKEDKNLVIEYLEIDHQHNQKGESSNGNRSKERINERATIKEV